MFYMKILLKCNSMLFQKFPMHAYFIVINVSCPSIYKTVLNIYVTSLVAILI